MKAPVVPIRRGDLCFVLLVHVGEIGEVIQEFKHDIGICLWSRATKVEPVPEEVTAHEGPCAPHHDLGWDTEQRKAPEPQQWVGFIRSIVVLGACGIDELGVIRRLHPQVGHPFEETRHEIHVHLFSLGGTVRHAHVTQRQMGEF